MLTTKKMSLDIGGRHDEVRRQGGEHGVDRKESGLLAARELDLLPESAEKDRDVESRCRCCWRGRCCWLAGRRWCCCWLARRHRALLAAGDRWRGQLDGRGAGGAWLELLQRAPSLRQLGAATVKPVEVSLGPTRLRELPLLASLDPAEVEVGQLCLDCAKLKAHVRGVGAGWRLLSLRLRRLVLWLRRLALRLRRLTLRLHRLALRLHRLALRLLRLALASPRPRGW